MGFCCKVYCGVLNIIGVKGRIQSRVVEKENEPKKYLIEVIAEKVTFLSTDNKEKK